MVTFSQNLIWLLGIFIFLNSCNSQHDKAVNEYLEAKQSFNKEFVEHFPSEIKGDFEWNASYSNEFDNFRLTLIYKIEKDSLNKLRNQYLSNSKAKYIASDSCLLIVNRFMNYENSGYLSIKQEWNEVINRQCYFDKPPIPNFWHNRYTTESTDCKLPPDSEIYVLDAQKAGQSHSKNALV